MVSYMTAAHALLSVPLSPPFAGACANDDASMQPDDCATITVSFEPQWPGTAPVACVEIRDGRGRLIEAFDGVDAVRVLGEAIELCRERCLTVTSIEQRAPSRTPTAAESERQQSLASQAWRAWSAGDP